MRGKESRKGRTRPAACGSPQAAFPAGRAIPARRSKPPRRAVCARGCTGGLSAACPARPHRWPVSGGSSASLTLGRAFCADLPQRQRARLPRRETERCTAASGRSQAYQRPTPPCARAAAQTSIRPHGGCGLISRVISRLMSRLTREIRPQPRRPVSRQAPSVCMRHRVPPTAQPPSRPPLARLTQVPLARPHAPPCACPAAPPCARRSLSGSVSPARPKSAAKARAPPHRFAA